MILVQFTESLTRIVVSSPNTNLIFSYAKFLSKQGEFKEALQRMEIAQAVFVKVSGKNEREYVDIVNNLAVLSLQVRLKNISINDTKLNSSLIETGEGL